METHPADDPDNFRFTVDADQQLRTPAQRLNRAIS
jgi:hypothetical protein